MWQRSLARYMFKTSRSSYEWVERIARLINGYVSASINGCKGDLHAW